jgi:hypothetical protein
LYGGSFSPDAQATPRQQAGRPGQVLRSQHSILDTRQTQAFTLHTAPRGAIRWRIEQLNDISTIFNFNTTILLEKYTQRIKLIIVDCSNHTYNNINLDNASFDEDGTTLQVSQHLHLCLHFLFAID